MLPNLADPNNPVVFLDIKIDREEVGRIIIELRKDICPKTCENFRALCTGEKGLSYRGSKFHKIIKLCLAQGGDISKKGDGTSGMSIYGKYFEDENFELKHDPGSVSMANFGKPNTNNSQFFITTVECYHLDGSNVVFGSVKKGLSIVNEMETYTTDEGKPKREITIADCGEIKPGENWGYCDNDATADTLPPFPADWDAFETDFGINEKIDILNKMKEAGNFFYRNEDYVHSARKYRKVTRYFNYFKDRTKDENDAKILDTFQLTNLTNLAATELKLHDYEDVRFSCNAAINIDANNIKAFYRRGIANLELKNYEMALDDLRIALKLSPNNKAIISEFERAKKHLMSYRALEKNHYKKMFA
ncbi:hypothetical protein PVAND_009333 [Polypedilum vanderplanki]|uniref:peptidylprolyl isomerase n=1 Tax=Polypedilum vanderplanki TaxID=319348 RepID=A0A9J6CDF2_POLVA|nr:hypothetical protein PVAND_009333 [Polypedilum vanderplanki]